MYEYGTAAQMPLAFLEILDLRARRSRWYRIEYSSLGVGLIKRRWSAHTELPREFG